MRGFQINRCFHDTLVLSMVNIFVCVCTYIIYLSKRTGMQQVSLDLTKIAIPYEGGLLPSNYWHSEEI